MHVIGKVLAVYLLVSIIMWFFIFCRQVWFYARYHYGYMGCIGWIMVPFIAGLCMTPVLGLIFGALIRLEEIGIYGYARTLRLVFIYHLSIFPIWVVLTLLESH